MNQPSRTHRSKKVDHTKKSSEDSESLGQNVLTRYRSVKSDRVSKISSNEGDASQKSNEGDALLHAYEQTSIMKKIADNFPELRSNSSSYDMLWLVVLSNQLEAISNVNSVVKTHLIIEKLEQAKELIYSKKGQYLLEFFKENKVLTVGFIREKHFFLKQKSKNTIRSLLEKCETIGICTGELINYKSFVDYYGKGDAPKWLATTKLYVLASADNNDYKNIYNFYAEKTSIRTSSVSKAKLFNEHVDFTSRYYMEGEQIKRIKPCCPVCKTETLAREKSFEFWCVVCDLPIIPVYLKECEMKKLPKVLRSTRFK